MNAVVALRPTSLNALIDQTKSTWDRADLNRADADDWYRRTGRLLIELQAKIKEEKGRGHWLTTLKEMDRDPRRAQQLMKDIKEPGTLEHQRAQNKEAQRKVRSKAKHVSHSGHPEPEEPEEYAGQPLDERWQYSLANLCGDIIAIAPYWHKTFSGWEQFDCPPHVRKLLKEATAALASISATVTSTKR